jgi:fructokinase
VPTDSITIDPNHPTGTVVVDLRGGQPSYTICESVAWDYIVADEMIRGIVAEADAVCFGSLAQRNVTSRDTIRQLIDHTSQRAARVFDVNLRQNFYSQEILDDSLRLANVAKLNDEELPIVSKLLGFAGSPREQIAAMVDHYELCLAACTRGAQGSLLYDGHDWCDLPGLATKVVDTIGAGDSFTAAMTMGLLSGWSIEQLGMFASEVAAYVCSFAGATPPLPGPLRARFQSVALEQHKAGV